MLNPRIDTLSKFGIFLKEALKEKKMLQAINKSSPHSYLHTRKMLEVLQKMQVIDMVQEETLIVMPGKCFQEFVVMCEIWDKLSKDMPKGNIEVLPDPVPAV